MKYLYFHATQYIRIKCPLWMTRQFYTSLYKWNRFIKRTLWKDENDLQKINKSMQKSVNGANYQGVLAWKHCWWGSGVLSSPLLSSHWLSIKLSVIVWSAKMIHETVCSVWRSFQWSCLFWLQKIWRTYNEHFANNADLAMDWSKLCDYVHVSMFN